LLSFGANEKRYSPRKSIKFIKGIYMSPDEIRGTGRHLPFSF